QARDADPVEAVGPQAAESLQEGHLRLRGGPSLLGRAAGRFPHPERQERGEQTRKPADEERRVPAPGVADPAAEREAQRRPDRDRDVEHRQRVGSLGEREEVGDEPRRDGPVPGLADADDGPRQEQDGERAGETRTEGGEAPDQDAQREDPATGIPVAEVTTERGDQHVDHDEDRLEQSSLRVVDVQRVLDPREDAGDQVPVQVVDDVDEGEDTQGEAGARERAGNRPRRRRRDSGFGCGHPSVSHRSSRTPQRRPRSETRAPGAPRWPSAVSKSSAPAGSTSARLGCIPGRTRRSATGSAHSRARTRVTSSTGSQPPCTRAPSYGSMACPMAKRLVTVPATPTTRTSRGRAGSEVSAARTASRIASCSAGAGGSVRTQRSVSRTEPMSRLRRKSTCFPRPWTSSVEPPPTSIATSPASPASVAKSCATARYDSRASSSPERISTFAPVRSRARSRNSDPLRASRAADVAVTTSALAPSLRASAAKRARTSRVASMPSGD